MKKKKFDYKFRDPGLFDLAMTQSGANSQNNNERLEFLGDRVLGLAVAETLYKTFPDEAEGELARRLAVLVSAKTLAKVARDFGLDKKIRHGHMTGGKMEHMTADAMESVIGAIYLDGGWPDALKFVADIWAPIAMADEKAPKDPKTELQELAQHHGKGRLPEYEFLESEKSGSFRVRVSALDKTAEGTGGTKKSATADAAKKLLGTL